MRADGTHVRRLTDSPGLDEGPEFSPDGTKIVFSSARDGQQELYVMNADGSDPASPDRQPGARRVARLAGAALRRPRPSRVRRRLARLRRRVERGRDAGAVPRGAAHRAALERGRRRGRRTGQGPRPDVRHDAAAVRPDRRAVHGQAQGAVRSRRRVRVARPGPGARAGGRRPVPRGSRCRGRRPRRTPATRGRPRPTRPRPASATKRRAARPSRPRRARASGQQLAL